jgi:Sugar-specific transcriptional regulator TrmB
MERMIFLLVVILVSGLVGGWAAFLMNPVSHGSSAERRRHALAQSCVLGVVAALCVPLFLKLAQIGLADRVFDTGVDIPLLDFLAFIGLCLVASFSAPRFMEWLTGRILHTDTAQERLAAEGAAPAPPPSAPASAAAHPPSRAPAGLPPAAADPAAATAGGQFVPVISEEERTALRAMTKRVHRTATGIAEDSGIARNRISELLDSLDEKGLIELTQGPTGGVRWKITPLGISALK